MYEDNRLHDYVLGNERANLEIYETVEVRCGGMVALATVRSSGLEQRDSQATLRKSFDNHLNGSDSSERLSRSKTVKFHDEVAA